MADKKVAAWQLADGVSANGPVQVPGVPGVFTPGEAVTAEALGVTEEEMDAAIEAADAGDALMKTTAAYKPTEEELNRQAVEQSMAESGAVMQAMPERDSWIPSEAELLKRSASPIAGLSAEEAEAKAAEEAGQTTHAEETATEPEGEEG